MNLVERGVGSEGNNSLLMASCGEVGEVGEERVHELFERWADEKPDSVAVRIGELELNYGELESRSNRLARTLSEVHGVTSDVLVGLCLDRSLEMLVGILGVLKAGGAYVPMDASYPAERLNFMLNDSSVGVLLSKGALPEGVSFDGSVLDLGDESSYAPDDARFGAKGGCNDLAYVIYTSGSTGRPKGVLVEHRGLANLARQHVSMLGLRHSSRLLQFASICFDASISEIFACFAAGGELVLPNVDRVRLAEQLAQYIESFSIDSVTLPPSLLSVLDPSKVRKECQLVSAGEVLPVKVARAWSKSHRLVNAYGPTEGTVCASYHEIGEGDSGDVVPIGCPMGNVRVYVLDEGGEPVPAGVSGEICIGGVGVARGYLNRPDLTQQRFVDDPFVQGGRMYRTGDLGRWFTNGTLEYLGRNDDQVKVRGYRIELGEIESAMLDCSGVLGAVVRTFDDGDGEGRLVGYWRGEALEADLQSFLLKRLPGYMIPSALMRLDRFPLSLNGKVDRKQLPEPIVDRSSDEDYMSPQGQYETRLAELWAKYIKVNRISRTDSFLALGGSSIMAFKVTAEIEREDGVRFQVSHLLGSTSLAECAEVFEQSDLETGQQAIELSDTRSYEASLVQQQVHLLEEAGDAWMAYRSHVKIRIIGDLDEKRMRNAMSDLLQRHEILRTGYRVQDGVLFGEIHSDVELPLRTVDLMPNTSESGASLDEEIATELNWRFDTSKPPLVRWLLVRLRVQEHVLLQTEHHFIHDGLSSRILLTELCDLYNGNNENLPELDFGYSDYCTDEKRWLASSSYLESRKLWIDKMDGFLSPESLFPARTENPTKKYVGKQSRFAINQTLFDDIGNAATRMGVSRYALCFSAFSVVCQKYSGKSKFVVASAVANRKSYRYERTVGMFVNAVPVAVRVNSKSNFETLAKDLAKEIYFALDNGGVSVAHMVEDLDLSIDLKGRSPFEIAFSFHDSMNLDLSLGDSKLEVTEGISNGSAKFPLNVVCILDAHDAGIPMEVFMEYDTSVFDPDWIHAFGSDLIGTLEKVVEDIQINVSQLTAVSDGEKRRLLDDFGRSCDCDVPNVSVVELFKESVERHPDGCALVFLGKSLTYKALDERSNRLAHHLRQDFGVDRGSIVGLFATRSIDAVVGMLAVLKAGGAFLPIDPLQPANRIEYILEDSEVRLVLADRGLPEEVSYDGRVVGLSESDITSPNAEQFNIELTGEDGIYYIYTSGSTGQPKAVVVDHRGVVNLAKYQIEEFGFASGKKCTSVANLAFDAFVLELWPTLLSGAELHLLDDSVLDSVSDFELYLKDNCIQISFLPTGLAKTYLSGGWDCSLDVLSVGGDRLDVAYPIKGKLYNLYGPTECTVAATACRVSSESTIVPIGRPIPNTRVYVLDEQGHLLPTGVPGEICIGGVGVARGYLKRPELTKERFVEDPFVEGGRMYRTGDLGRWLADGNLEFLGRNDDQVKVRGYRIELGEVESALRECEGVREAVVIALEDSSGDQCLIGYWTGEVEESVLLEALSKRLPSYMVPSAFMHLDFLPLTRNGKVDRARLPEAPLKLGSEGLYEAPRDEVEAELAAMFCETLGVAHVGIDDDFFSLGGHSLKAVRLVSMIQSIFVADLKVRMVFEGVSTVRAMAAEVRQGRRSGRATIPLTPERDSYPVSSQQERLYAIQQTDNTGIAYNMASCYELEGEADPERMCSALTKLIESNSNLRTLYEFEDGELRQRIVREYETPFESMEGEGLAEGAEGFIRPFDLARQCPVRVRLCRLSSGSSLLFVDMHHIAADGGCYHRLVGDLLRAYQGAPLPREGLRYVDFALWQREGAGGGESASNLSYWRDVYSDPLPRLELPYDRPRPASRSYRGSGSSFILPTDLCSDLRSLARGSQATLHMTLLALWKVLLARLGGCEDVSVGVPASGRDRRELDGVGGMFVNTLPIRTRPRLEMSFDEYLLEVRSAMLEGLDRQRFELEKLVESVNDGELAKSNDLFDTIFNYMEPTASIVDAVEIPLGSRGSSKFDLSFFVQEVDGEVHCKLEYSTDLFERSTVEGIGRWYEAVARQVVADGGALLGDLCLMSLEEKRSLLNQFSGDVGEVGEERVHELFEHWADEKPDLLAVRFGELELSYGELESRSNRLARTLREAHGVRSDILVGLCVDRSLEMLVGILAVLKAGGAYVPLDASYPAERLSFMLDDSSVGVMLSKGALPEGVKFSGSVVDLGEESSYASNDARLESLGSSRDLAYVIYTSGSTGQPKGVLVEHSGLVNLLKWQSEEMPLNSGDRVLQFASVGFDVSFQEIFSTLWAGGTLILLTEETRRDPRELWSLISKERIKRAFIPFVAMEQLLAVGVIGKSESVELRELITAGEQLKITTVSRRSFSKMPDCTLYNHYGPTESHVVTTYRLDGPVDQWSSLPPIGRPIANTRIYILDVQGEPVPVGVPGEIYIGGVGVARGYLKRPELTQERFVEDPFAKEGRMYRTGDLGRWLTDGNLEFLGRNDDQVKIRGYRIELGEVESALRECEGVREAVVKALEDGSGEQRLVGYWTGEEDERVITDFLSMRLPDYMVPSALMHLDSLPITRNGKVDRTRLPEVSVELALKQSYVAPHDEIEAELVAIVSEVLGVERVGVEDDFFALGGHSLKAVRLVSMIRDVFSVELKVRLLFEGASTVKALAVEVRQGGRPSSTRVSRSPEQESYPVSTQQARLYAIQETDRTGMAYNMPTGYELKEDVDPNRMRSSLLDLMAANSNLRTLYDLSSGELRQRVVTVFEAPFELCEASSVAAAVEGFVRPFDLTEQFPIRVRLCHLSYGGWVLFLDMHHIAADGNCYHRLVGDLLHCYSGSPLRSESLRYVDYALWQQEGEGVEECDANQLYWEDLYSERPPELELPMDRPRPSSRSYEGANVSFALPPEVCSDLRSLARGSQATLHMTLLALWKLLLARLGGCEDVSVGVPASGRDRRELDGVGGMFVNTLPIRTSPQLDKSFEEYLLEVRSAILEGLEHQNFELEDLVEAVGAPDVARRNPLFDTLFNYLESTSLDDGAGMVASVLQLNGRGTAKSDLSLFVQESEGGVLCHLEYSTDLFDQSTAENIGRWYGILARKVAVDSTARLGTYDLLEQDERHQLLNEFLGGKVDYPRDKALHELFEEQAYRSPDAVAVVYGEEELTYRELDERSNRLAWTLSVEHGVKSDTLVGVCLERCSEMIIALMGILKAGGAYLPMDPSYPIGRLDFMLEDGGIKTVIVKGENPIERGEYEGTILDLNDKSVYSERSDSLGVDCLPSSLAYCIYTSGSTGHPKGVLIEHQNVNRLFAACQGWYSFDENDIWTMFHYYGFDFSVWEIFGALLHGGRLIVVPFVVSRSPELFYDLLLNEKVTVLSQTPSAFRMLVAEDLERENSNMQLALRHVVFGGEALEFENLRPWIERHGDDYPSLSNMYGITETTVHVTYKRIRMEDLESGLASNVGVPIPDLSVHILDPTGTVQPVGLPGEIYVGGAGVARGYLNRPELTNERFLTSELEPGGRLYRTGDLARWRSDGSIEYIGRIDDQVQVRGFRIELGEIQSTLSRAEGVLESVVIAIPFGEEVSLIAYYTSDRDLNPSTLRDELELTLAAYMIPSHFVALDEIPLTPNGKIDRKSLPKPEENVISSSEYIAPRNETEQLLVQLWQDILSIEKVGINDDFFELGGHSLKAVRLVSMIRSVFGVELKVRMVFEGVSTVKALAAEVRQGGGAERAAIPLAPESDSYPVSTQQERLYAIQQTDSKGVTYNMPSCYELEGEVDPERIQTALTLLIESNSNLRTLYGFEGGELRQRVLGEFETPFEFLEADGPTEASEGFIRPFDLSGQCPVRVRLSHLSSGASLLLVDMHHIAADGGCYNRLVTDLLRAYEGAALPCEDLRYVDFAHWQREGAGADEYASNLSYWREVYSDALPRLELPCDRLRPASRSYRGARSSFILPAELCSDLRSLARGSQATLHMTLLALWKVLLARLGGCEDVSVGVPASGRDRRELDGVGGMFVNTLPIRTRPRLDKSFEEYLLEVRSAMLEGLDCQSFELEKLVEFVNDGELASSNGIFDTIFNYIEPASSSIRLEQIPLRGRVAAKSDISLIVQELDGEVHCQLEYSIDLFDQSTVEGIGRWYEAVARQVVADGGALLDDLNLMSPEEKQSLLNQFSGEVGEVGEEQVHELFERWADEKPDLVAVRIGELEFSYGELDSRSNRLARTLREAHNVGSDVLVGLCLEGSLEMLVGIFGVLKAGGAYLPLDASYPAEHLNLMLDDSSVGLLLSKGALPEGVNFDGIVVDLGEESSFASNDARLESKGSSRDLAYVIYTSGSTGRPKGALIEHRGVMNLAKQHVSMLGLRQGSRQLQFASICFDASVSEIFACFAAGGELVLPDMDRVRLAEQLAQYIESFSIDSVTLPPSLLSVLDPSKVRRECQVVSAGEVLPVKVARAWSMSHRLVNAYGPTEGTVCASYHEIGEGDSGDIVPIGRPIGNVRVYVLDEGGEPVPAGVSGEICIGGVGVARGYINRPELTQQRFVADPFELGGRMYRTGDFGRWLAVGTLEYLGRNDDQVKVRGYRIELGEIESAMLDCSGVLEAVVRTFDDGDGKGRLVGYWRGEALDVDLQSFLSKRLPSYMIPSALMRLDRFPLSLNGKVDRKQLPEPIVDRGSDEVDLEAMSEVESALTNMFSELLGIERVGIEDDFFALGGHSLKAVKLVGDINSRFMASLTIEDLYDLRTPSHIALILDIQ